MFCTECGTEGSGKFCGSCGHRLGVGQPVAPATVDWQQSCDFQLVISVAEVRQRIERAKSSSGGKVSGSQFMQLLDNMATPLTGGVSSIAIAKIAQPLTTKLGIRTGKQRAEFLPHPPGVVLAQIAEALAAADQQVTGDESSTDQCTLHAILPLDVRSMEGRLTIDVRRATGGTNVSAAAVVDGAWYDWGKCQTRLDALFTKLRAA